MLNQLVFYFSGIISLIGHIIVWKYPNYGVGNIAVFNIVLLLSLIYSLMIVQLCLTDPQILINMTYSGIIEQYQHLSIIISSIYHFGATDLLVAFGIRYCLLNHLNLSLSKSYMIIMASLLFLWCPIGIVLFIVYLIASKKIYLFLS